MKKRYIIVAIFIILCILGYFYWTSVNDIVVYKVDAVLVKYADYYEYGVKHEKIKLKFIIELENIGVLPVYVNYGNLIIWFTLTNQKIMDIRIENIVLYPKSKYRIVSKEIYLTKPEYERKWDSPYGSIAGEVIERMLREKRIFVEIVGTITSTILRQYIKDKELATVIIP